MQKLKMHAKAYYQKMPLWKKLVALFLIFAMPLFFSFYRVKQLQNTINETTPATNENSPDTTGNQG